MARCPRQPPRSPRHHSAPDYREGGVIAGPVSRLRPCAQPWAHGHAASPSSSSVMFYFLPGKKWERVRRNGGRWGRRGTGGGFHRSILHVRVRNHNKIGSSLPLQQHRGPTDLVIDLFVWSGVCFHSLHVLVGFALTKSSDACTFIPVCAHVRDLHTRRGLRYICGACRLPLGPHCHR